MANGLSGWSGVWKEPNWEIGAEEVWVTGYLGKRYVDRLHWIGKKREDICAHVNSHQRVTSAEEDFNNQVGRMTCSVGTSWPRPPVNPIVTQWAPEQNGPGDGDGGYRWASLTEADLDVATLSIQTASSRNQHRVPNMASTPGDWSTPWRQNDCHGLLPLWKGQHFILIRRDTQPWLV